MAVRPKMAASLIAVWHDHAGTPHLLMGRRHASVRFLPGFLVFPGGRFERSDRTHRKTVSLDDVSAQVLDAESSCGAAALFNTALRETLEETGVDLVKEHHRSAHYVARAVTPPSMPVRYDTHFFLVVLASSDGPPSSSGPRDGELEAVDWFSASRLNDERLHHVTAAVARHAVGSLLSDEPERLLIANRRPKRWSGLMPLRSAILKASQQDQEDGSRS